MLENFKVLEIIKNADPACLIIDDKALRFTKAIISMLDYPAYTRLLMDTEGKRLAIQISRGNEANSFAFSKGKDVQKTAIKLQNAAIVSLIRGMMPEWGQNDKFSIIGKFSKEDKAIIFDLNQAKPYSRRSSVKGKK